MLVEAKEVPTSAAAVLYGSATLELEAWPNARPR